MRKRRNSQSRMSNSCQITNRNYQISLQNEKHALSQQSRQQIVSKHKKNQFQRFCEILQKENWTAWHSKHRVFTNQQFIDSSTSNKYERNDVSMSENRTEIANWSHKRNQKNWHTSSHTQTKTRNQLVIKRKMTHFSTVKKWLKNRCSHCVKNMFSTLRVTRTGSPSSSHAKNKTIRPFCVNHDENIHKISWINTKNIQNSIQRWLETQI